MDLSIRFLLRDKSFAALQGTNRQRSAALFVSPMVTHQLPFRASSNDWTAAAETA